MAWTPRTTAALVQGIIETDTSVDLTPFLDTATSIVTQFCTDSTFGYSTDQLEIIERWLAAHFYAIRDMRPAMEKAGDVSAAYQYKVGLFLENTMYGQQALALDFQGALAAYQKRMETGVPPKPGVRWMGKKGPGSWFGIEMGD